MNKRLQEGFRKDLIERRGVLQRQVEAGETEAHAIAEIDAALARIDDGDYGLCEDCDEDIPMLRLRAVPAARLCVECTAERDKSRGRSADDDAAADDTPR